MATTLITKNSVVGSKRPTAAQLVIGELGLNAEASDPGLYFEDSAGNIRKVGGCSYGPTAPNVSAAGQAGNSVGELWYDTGAGSLKLWDGSAWSIASGAASQFDWQSAAGAPTVTTRTDGSALLDGDLYWDQTADKLYGWNAAASAWVPIGGSAGQFDWQAAAGAPTATTRSDGTALVDGDQYWDQTNDKLYGWNAAASAWVSVGGTAGQFDWQAAAGTPTATTRSDGSALVDGDQYWDQTNDKLYGWNAAASAWVSVGGSGAAAQFDWQAAAGLPTVTTRSDGSALVDGDQYWDQTADKLYGWNAASSAWALIGPSGAASGSDSQASATAPSVRSDGTSALQAGDLWYDTTNELLFVYDGSTFEPTIAGVDVQAAAAAPTTRSNGKTLVEGDLYYDTATDAIYAWDGSAWVAVAATAATLLEMATGTATNVYASPATAVAKDSPTGAMLAPSGSNAQRPATAVTGMVRHNTTSGQLEFYDGSSWTQVGGGSMNIYTYNGNISQQLPTPDTEGGFNSYGFNHGLGLSGSAKLDYWFNTQTNTTTTKAAFPIDINVANDSSGASGVSLRFIEFSANALKASYYGGGLGGGTSQITFTYT